MNVRSELYANRVGVPTANPKLLTATANRLILALMSDLCRLIWCALTGLFRSRAALEAEILVLRHQLNVLRRKSPKRLAFGNIDRLVFAGLYRVAPGVLDALKILKPQTVIRWHHAGLRAYWRWKSRPHRGRPKTPAAIRQSIYPPKHPFRQASGRGSRAADQWHGPDYRYIKIRGHDGGLYILRFDEPHAEWALTMFKSARAQIRMA